MVCGTFPVFSTYTQSFDVENRLTQVTQSNNSTATRFSYDASGQRTKTEIETGNEKTITYYPFPNYEEEVRQTWVCLQYSGRFCISYGWSTTATIKRSTYHLAGQAIATRITGDPEQGNNGLFYFLLDHLGSTTLMVTTAGVIMSTAYFLPYGGYRYPSTPPPSELTDTGFTGHKHNDSVGLIYMNARYYVPYLNRFISADSIVPQPTDPQSYNRYSYARNNPLKYVDPTGHYYADLPNLNGLQGDPLPPEKTDGCITRPERCSESSQEVFGEPIEDAFLTGRSAGFDNDPDNEIPDHLGIDAGPVDNVLASANGIVRIVDENGYAGTGKVVIVEYVYDVIPDNLREAWGLEPGQSVFFEYQHLGSISVVEGQMVKQGDILGTVGGTGNANGNEHLHLEARIGSYGALVDHTSYDSTTMRCFASLRIQPAWKLQPICGVKRSSEM